MKTFVIYKKGKALKRGKGGGYQLYLTTPHPAAVIKQLSESYFKHENFFSKSFS